MLLPTDDLLFQIKVKWFIRGWVIVDLYRRFLIELNGQIFDDLVFRITRTSVTVGDLATRGTWRGNLHAIFPRSHSLSSGRLIEHITFQPLFASVFINFDAS